MKSLKLIRLVTILITALFVSAVNAVDLKITCDLPTTNQDGSSITPSEFTELTVDVVRCDGSTTTIIAEDPSKCEFIDSATMPRNICGNTYKVTASNVSGKGTPSAQAYIEVITDPASPPSAPTNVKVFRVLEGSVLYLELEEGL